MKNLPMWIYYRGKAFLRFKKIAKYNTPQQYSETLSVYAGKELMTADKINQDIIELINSNKPFLAGRFGSTELLNMQSYDFGSYGKHGLADRFEQLCNWSGFFPNDINLLPQFVKCMKTAVANADILACWFHPFEDFYIKHYLSKDSRLTYLLNLEPWMGSVHWTSALAGKKVLVIHPFTETIKDQYTRRTEIFPNTDILPEFDLKVLKAVQTLAGTKDPRFNTWFDALEWMYREAMNIDFDIAIIGCGAYGLPLAAKLKASGKQAIHLAGATQLLFGIRGNRWDHGEAFAYVRRWYNSAWVYPGESDKIANGKIVESACYWGNDKNEEKET